MTLRPSFVAQCPLLPSPPVSSLPVVPDPVSDLAHAASPTVTRCLATLVTDPTFKSAATYAFVTELIDFATVCRLDYLASLVSDFDCDSPPSVGGELALGCDIFEDSQFELECLAAAVPHLAAMLLAPEGDPRSYAEAIKEKYSSQWQTAMDAQMASWKSTGTYVDAVPPLGANIVDCMWIFRVKRPPGSPSVFKPLVASLWSLSGARKWHDTLMMTLTAIGFAPSTADPSLFLRTDPSLSPFYILVYVDDLVFATANTEALALVKAELQRGHTCIDLGELRSYLGL
ncbi:unnamed protein product [Closterium sp. NIES-53]